MPTIPRSRIVDLTSEDSSVVSLESSTSHIANIDPTPIDLDAIPPVYMFIEKSRRGTANCRVCGERIAAGVDRVRFSLRTGENQFLHIPCVRNSANFLYLPQDPRTVGFEPHYTAAFRRRTMATLVTLLPPQSHRRMRGILRPIDPTPPRGLLPSRRNILRSVLPSRDGPAGGIERLPVVKGPRTPETDCAICLAVMRATANVIRLPCGHDFHKTCITRWLATNPRCPIDRQDVRSDTK